MAEDLDASTIEEDKMRLQNIKPDGTEINLQIEDDQLKGDQTVNRRKVNDNQNDLDRIGTKSPQKEFEISDQLKQLLLILLLLATIIIIYLVTSRSKIYYFKDVQNITCKTTNDYLYKENCVTSCPTGFKGDIIDNFCKHQACSSQNTHFKQFHSQYMTDSVYFHVYEPDSYHNDQNQKFYPIIYFFSGFNQTYNWYNSQFKMQCLASELETVFVSISGNNGWYVDAQPTSEQCSYFQAMLELQLFPKIESQYRILSDQKFQFLAGFDMGGFAALRLVTKLNKNFAGAFVIDPIIVLKNLINKGDYQQVDEYYADAFESDLNVIKLVQNQTESIKHYNTSFLISFSENSEFQNDILALKQVFELRGIDTKGFSNYEETDVSKIFQKHIINQYQEFVDNWGGI